MYCITVLFSAPDGRNSRGGIRREHEEQFFQSRGKVEKSDIAVVGRGGVDVERRRDATERSLRGKVTYCGGRRARG